MKVLARYELDCGRMGSIGGVFTTTTEDIEKIIGKTVNFGEVLGKHSEITDDIEEGDIEILTDDITFINQFEEYVGSVGYDPFYYIEEFDDEGENDEE